MAGSVLDAIPEGVLDHAGVRGQLRRDLSGWLDPGPGVLPANPALQTIHPDRRDRGRAPGDPPGAPAGWRHDHDPGLVLPDSGPRAEPQRDRDLSRHLPLLRSVADGHPVPRLADPRLPGALRLDHARGTPVSYTHLRAQETRHDLVCR